MASGAKIADVFFRALLDDGTLQTQAVKSGQKAGETMGKSMSARIGSAIGKGLFATVAAGSAIAGKGLLELDGIVADFTAQTGASADEADRARVAINRLAGDNLQSLHEVGSAYTAVRVQMGLQGDELERITNLTLKYATATKQDAVAAVKDLDDIQDAWNLTAADTQSLMDELIASQQKYGGSITDNQKALAAMAPQLKALNADWREGVGLLNLFAASGLDASVAQRALNTAVKNLQPGQTLDDLVRQISAIEDPTKRAQEAIRVFGARGGVALANALRPGITSLSQFEVSASDAAGATDKAAAAIEDAFPNWLALRIKGIGSAIIGLGQTIGPLGSALTGIIALGGALGFDKLFGKIGPKATAGLAGLWKKVATSSLVTGAIGFASDKAATLYLKTLFAGDALARAAAGLWAALPLSSVVKEAIAAAARTSFGLFAAGFTAAAVAAPLVLAVYLIPKVLPDPAGAKAALDKGLQRNGLPTPEQVINGTAATTAAAGAGSDAGAAFGKAYIENVEKYLSPGALAPATSEAVTLSVKGAFGSDVAARNGYAKAFGRRLAGSVADGIKSTRDAFDQAWNDFLDSLKNVETPAKREARLLGRLASKELAAGLRDSRPEVRARANEVLQDTIDELGQLVRRGQKIGKDGMDALKRGMKSKNADIRLAATSIWNTIHAHLPDSADGNRWGRSIGAGLVAGMKAYYTQIGQVAGRMASIIAAYLQTNSPSKLGPLSEDGGPEGYGKNIGAGITKGLSASLPNIGGMLAGSIGTPALATAGASISTGPSIQIGALHLHDIGSDVSDQRSVDFGRKVMREVASNFRHDGARNGIHPERP